MNSVEWIMFADAVALIAVTIGSAVTDVRASAAQCRATAADWALLESRGCEIPASLESLPRTTERESTWAGASASRSSTRSETAAPE
jgi:hypothetical protein